MTTTSVKAVSRHPATVNNKPLTCENSVSEGGLELSGTGGQQDSPGIITRCTDLARQLAAAGSHLTRNQPDSAAPVSREVSQMQSHHPYRAGRRMRSNRSDGPRQTTYKEVFGHENQHPTATGEGSATRRPAA